MTQLLRVEQYLRSVASRKEPDGPLEGQLRDVLKEAKSEAVRRGDRDGGAKLVWCYEQILDIHGNYLVAFDDMKRGKYYSAWRLLERVEIALASLGRHFELRDNEYKLQFIQRFSVWLTHAA